MVTTTVTRRLLNSLAYMFTLSGVIMFSDILTPLPAMGIDFTIVEGKGPKIANPIKSIEVDELITAYLPH